MCLKTSVIKSLVFIVFCFGVTCDLFSQNTRREVRAKVSQVHEIIEDNSQYIKTSNFETEKELIMRGISPICISTYRFESSSEYAKLKVVEEIYFHSDRKLISLYSSEKNPRRTDYTSYWLSQVATHTYGDVTYHDGMYYTTQSWFNLE